MMKLSIIVPVFNRPKEIKELLTSLSEQTNPNFDVLIIEDGSSEDCKEIVNAFSTKMKIQYFFKPNTGPGDSRNFGTQKSKANYFIFLDSDCLAPPHYIETVLNYLDKNYVDAFGGPDTAHPSFTNIQKAINYSMTSLLTTGGIRGKKKAVGKFQPRSFNMGISKEVYQKTKGFRAIFPGEDTDFSLRIMEHKFTTALIDQAFVYHKRRIDLSKFSKQVFGFGKARPILNNLHPWSVKISFFFPTVFLIGFITSLLLAFIHPLFLIPYSIYLFAVFIDATITNKNIKIGVLALVSTLIQFIAYGSGFLLAFVKINILKQSPKQAFPSHFKWEK